MTCFAGIEARALRIASTAPACAIASTMQHARHHRVPGKVPGEERLVDGDVLERDDLARRRAR